MEIKEFLNRPGMDQNEKLMTAYTQFDKLLSELKKRDLSDECVQKINDDIDQLNAYSESDKGLKKMIAKSQACILTLLEKEHKLVVKNHYRNTWMSLGMAAFGVPLGVVFGLSLGNLAFLGIGLPIGMVIGMAMGSEMDKKAQEAGRQIDLELSY